MQTNKKYNQGRYVISNIIYFINVCPVFQRLIKGIVSRGTFFMYANGLVFMVLQRMCVEIYLDIDTSSAKQRLRHVLIIFADFTHNILAN